MNCAWKELLLLLPPWLKESADSKKLQLQEVRLRQGKKPMLVSADGNKIVERIVTREDLMYTVNTASRYSPWTAATIAKGYIAARGGHRVGLCGETIARDGKVTGIGTVTSVSIRVARDFPGISRNLGLHRETVLILGPPGCGKTTLLRDLIRQRSRRENVAVVDERGELFPPAGNFEVGENTDVLTGCSKADGIGMLLCAMTPDCIAVDEITLQEDCEAVLQAGGSGVQFLATAHAESLQDLCRRPVYRQLKQSGIFETAVILGRDKSWRVERM